MNQYKTIDIARMIGIHVNTVRLYEKCALISKPERLDNGYRIFTELHVEQFRLARAMLRVEVLQNGLRKQAADIIKAAAMGKYEAASELTRKYIRQLEVEKENAEEAIRITREIFSGLKGVCAEAGHGYTRKDAALLLDVTVDTLRNWELNGLFTIKRKENGYRVYSVKDLQFLKIIRSLRCANYSLSSILRMLKALSADPDTDIGEAINTPQNGDEIISACDKLLTSLQEAKENAIFAQGQIEKMNKMKKMTE